MNETTKFSVEEVDAVEAPPKARVDDAVVAPAPDEAVSDRKATERQRDYLDGFLAGEGKAEPKGEAGGDLQQAVIDRLKEIYDPEIPVNIYDLGLIYGVDVSDDGHVAIAMTLTTPHCPVAETMPGEVEMQAGSVPGVGVAEVNLVWDPPWDPGKMSDEARLELGML